MNYVLQVLFILMLMSIGYAARKRGVVSAVGTSEMVRILIAIIYPCLIFSSVTQLKAQELADNWIMPVMAMAIAITGLILGLLALRGLKNIDQKKAFNKKRRPRKTPKKARATRGSKRKAPPRAPG